MKKIIFIFCVSLFCFGCDEEVKVDEKKLDEAGEKLQQSVEKGVDSIGVKLNRLKDKLDKDDSVNRE